MKALNTQETYMLDILEHQILVLESEWEKYDETVFTAWDNLFPKIMEQHLTNTELLTDRDIKKEKKEFRILQQATLVLFRKCSQHIKGNRFGKAKLMLETTLTKLMQELTALLQTDEEMLQLFQNKATELSLLFDKKFGYGFYEQNVIKNLEMRLGLLSTLQQQYLLLQKVIQELS